VPAARATLSASTEAPPLRPTLLLCCLLAACGETSGGADAPDARAVDAAPAPDAAPVADAAPLPDAVADAAPPAGRPLVLINEVDCHDPVHVELVNVGAGAARLAGWEIVAGSRTYALGGSLAPGGRLDVVDPVPVHCGETAVELRRPDGRAGDAVLAPLGPAGATWGRLPDGGRGFEATRPTPGAPNVAFEAPAPELFDVATVHEIAIELPPDAVVSLGRAPGTPVDATLSVTDLADADHVPVALHVGGRDGRYRRADLKPVLIARFDRRPPRSVLQGGVPVPVPDAPTEGRLHGLRSVVLDSAQLDPAKLTTWLAGEVLRAAGVPAPRVGFAHLTVNGADYGLYALVEAYDEEMLGRLFPSTWQLVAGAGLDLAADQDDGFDVELGPPHSRHGLAPVVAALDAGGPGWFAATGELVAWDRVLRELAAEVWIGNVDGYAIGRRSAVFHVDAVPLLDVLPAGTDLAFRAHAPAHAGAGRLLAACLADAGCRAAYDAALADVSAALADRDWRPEVEALAARLRPYVAADPRSDHSPAMFDAAVTAILEFLGTRPVEMGGLAACLATGEDADGDGAICDADCAPDDAAVHPGAVDACGDGVDQDCDGVPDDGPDCVHCTTLTRGDHGYLVCPQPRTWDDARQLCRSKGADLAIIDDPGENDWLHARAVAVAREDFWLGLSDQAEEGHFVGVDGRDPPFQHWGGGEPNDYGGAEDCAQFRGDGYWNDLGCGAQLGVICEKPCDPSTDADHDGYGDCGADCDDGDHRVHPGATDVCDDGVDQDCDGIPDDGPGCDCFGATREGRRYLFCPQPVTYDAARALCQGRGGDLAVVDDAGENAWLYRTAVARAPERWWIGLDDRDREGTFVTVAGQRPAFTAWSRGEPNDSGWAEDCAHFWEDGPTWNDIGCDAQHGAICELP
jgi:hypothetical protein